MTLDRRTLLLATAAALIATDGHARSIAEQGLFWKATAPRQAPCTLFGYARLAAAAAPRVVADGETFASQCERVVADVPNIEIRGPSVSRTELPPVSERIPAPVAARIRAAVETKLGGRLQAAQLSALEVMVLLVGEDGSLAGPQISSVIAGATEGAGRPLSHLLSAQEYTSGRILPDLAALDRRMGGDLFEYLLALRDKVGPIGRYEQTLYAERRIGDLARLTDEMKSHGALSVAELMGLSGDIETTLARRAVEMVRSAATTTFMILPVGALTEENGIVAMLRRDGAEVTMVA